MLTSVPVLWFWRHHSTSKQGARLTPLCVWGGRPAQIWQEALKGALECEIIQCHPRNTPGLRGDKTDVSWWAGGKYKPVCIIRMPQKLVALRRSEVGAIMHASYTCCSLMPSRSACEVKCENKQTVSACEEQGACMHVRPIASGEGVLVRQQVRQVYDTAVICLSFTTQNWYKIPHPNIHVHIHVYNMYVHVQNMTTTICSLEIVVFVLHTGMSITIKTLGYVYCTYTCIMYTRNIN